jgi:ubiquinone/menaquinone biosynthesis C-methylase UbiE
MEAFAPHWIDKFDTVYDTTPLSGITWCTGAASPRLVRMVSEGVIQRGTQVVDMGCGPGVDSIFLGLQGMRVVGVDRSAAALETAEKVARLWNVSVEWVHGDFLNVPLETGWAEVVNDSFIFHNIDPDNRARFAEEVARLVRPGGLYVMRGYSDRMGPGSGSLRLTADDIYRTFSPAFDCEFLTREQGLPTDKKANQAHWVTVWRRKGYVPGEATGYVSA